MPEATALLQATNSQQRSLLGEQWLQGIGHDGRQVDPIGLRQVLAVVEDNVASDHCAALRRTEPLAGGEK